MNCRGNNALACNCIALALLENFLLKMGIAEDCDRMFDIETEKGFIEIHVSVAQIIL